MRGQFLDAKAIDRLIEKISADQPDVEPLEGFEVNPPGDPFQAFLGPYFLDTRSNQEGYDCRMAFKVDGRHLNARNVVHGGAMLSFADAAMGAMVWRQMARRPVQTLSMEANFLKPAMQGDWIICECETIRRTPSIVFTKAQFFVGSDLALTFSATWKVARATPA